MADHNLARNLKFLRKSHGLSQQKLAEQLGLKRNNIASYEAGIVEPKPLNFLKMALFFGVSPRALLQEEAAGLLPEADDTPGYGHELNVRLNRFAQGTEDLQKVFEGFQEFYSLPSSSPTAPNKQQDLETLMAIIAQLLQTNWEFMESITRNQGESPL